MVLLGCLAATIYKKNERLEVAFTPDFVVLLVKFPCAVALHFFLHPEVSKGLTIMKFANN